MNCATDTNKISLILGRRNSGKTVYVKGDEKLGVKGLIKTYLELGFKVLIVDTIDHPSYQDIRILPVSKLHLWQKGVYRIFVRRESIPQLNYQLNTLDNLWNTLIIYEDAYKHTFKQIDRNLLGLMGDSKQKNIDIVFMYWSWLQAPGDLYRMLDYIELFKTKDSPEVRKDFIADYYEQAMQAYKQVKEDSNRYAHKFIDTEL